MTEKIILATFFLFPFQIFSQVDKRDNIWMLGGATPLGYPKFGVDFNMGSADTFSLQRPMGFFLTNSSICDTNGQLLFYTNGNFVSNRIHQLMPGSAGFNPGYENAATYPHGSGLYQGAMILPWPETTDKYIIIHLSADTFHLGNTYFERPLSLRYSVIDMSLDSGKGDFKSINQTLIHDTLVSGRISACRHANGRDWWIISHKLWSDQFYEFLLTPDTIEFYQYQNIGSTITHRMDVLGAGVFTNDGNQFAFLNSDTTLNIFEFDRCSGMLSNPIYIYFLDTLNLGTISCAFSSSGRYLYVNNNFHIFQLDMQAGNIPASSTIVAEYDNYLTSHGFRTIFGIMRLAPDKKIYLATYEGSNVFHVINSPDSSGLSCNVTQHNFILPGYNTFSMPNVPNYSLGTLAGSVCDSLISVPEIVLEKSTITIFPNPASDYISIRTPFEIAPYRFFEIYIYSAIGSIIFHQIFYSQSELSNINIRNLSSGVYFCKLYMPNKIFDSKYFSIIH